MCPLHHFSCPSACCLPSVFISHFFFLFLHFLPFLLSSAQLILLMSRKHVGEHAAMWWINHEACVLEDFNDLLLGLFVSLMIFPLSLTTLFSLSFSHLLFPFFPRSSVYLPNLPFSISPSWFQMSSLPSQETHHPPTVLSDWTPKPQNFCVKIQFVLTWARGVNSIIISLYYINGTTLSWQKRQIRSRT